MRTTTAGCGGATALAAVLCAVIALAAPGARGDQGERPPETAELVGPPVRAAEKAAPAGETSVPTDLRPRPLGPVRPMKSVSTENGGTGADAAQRSAAGALWDNSLVRTTGSLLIVLLLIVALAAVTKKVAGKSGSLAAAIGAGGKAPAGLLEVLGRYPLTRGQTLILLKVDQRILLLSQTTTRVRGGAGSLTTLCEITDPEEVASILVKAGEHEGTGQSAKFSAMLHAFDRSHGADEAEDHTELDLRAVQKTAAGDRAELWDERAAAPVVHKFPAMPVPAASTAPTRAAEAYAQAQAVTSGAGSMMSGGGGDSFGAIRQRLHALRGEAHR